MITVNLRKYRNKLGELYIPRLLHQYLTLNNKEATYYNFSKSANIKEEISQIYNNTDDIIYCYGFPYSKQQLLQMEQSQFVTTELSLMFFERNWNLTKVIVYHNENIKSFNQLIEQMKKFSKMKAFI
jgi:hypothetical protein